MLLWVQKTCFFKAKFSFAASEDFNGSSRAKLNNEADLQSLEENLNSLKSKNTLKLISSFLLLILCFISVQKQMLFHVKVHQEEVL